MKPKIKPSPLTGKPCEDCAGTGKRLYDGERKRRVCTACEGTGDANAETDSQCASLAWYATTSAGGQQGLIADENDKTGRTIALTYDPKDAAPIAHAMNAHAGLVAFIKSFAAPNGPKIYRDMDHTDLFEILEGLNKEARAVLRAAGEL